MPINIVRQDITKIKADAIVNAANTQLLMGSGVCGAIFRAAGAEEMQAACNKLSPIHTGEAAITLGFGLPCRFVIHAAGPVYSREDPHASAALLHQTYLSALQLATENDCESIAFPLISSGIYGYPREEALSVAMAAIKDYLTTQDMDVTLAIFDAASFVVSRELLGDIDSYIDQHYVEAHSAHRRILLEVEREALEDALCAPMATVPKAASGIDERIQSLDEPFAVTLLHLIDARGRTDADVYKRANIDRKLFSKIRSGKNYMPGKRTILALCVALELTLAETDDLLERAGYALSHSRKFDVIVEYFIVKGRYDIFEINEVLFKYDQPLLGA